jgi:hypothetical protein
MVLLKAYSFKEYEKKQTRAHTGQDEEMPIFETSSLSFMKIQKRGDTTWYLLLGLHDGVYTVGMLIR